MKSGKRTDQSVAGVFTDLSDLLEEGTTSPMRKISVPPPPAEKELHRFVPTSLMVDTQPNEFQPIAPERLPSLIPQGPDESAEVAELLKAPSSQTIRFSNDANPAAAFAPAAGAPAPAVRGSSANKTDPMRDGAARDAVVSAIRASSPSIPDGRPSVAPAAPVVTARVKAPARSFSPSSLVLAIVIAASIASIVTALAGAKLVRGCRQGSLGERICALAP